jgi:bifunctional DNA-binding transcriptional regulator/antitoxin component of YhaV-PrlF toxin-antitoxin module
MTITVKNQDHLVVPPSVQRKAGIKAGDRLEFKVSAGVNTITSARARGYKPTKSELAAIHKGEAAIARGDSVSLSEFLHGLASKRRKAGTKANRKASR